MLIDNVDDIIKKNNDSVYNCGSQNLCKFLVNHNYFPINTFLSKTSVEKKRPRHIWVFLKTDDLSKLLLEWSNGKQRKQSDIENE